jgi:putative hydrolase of the HAD superfamily
LKAVLFDLDDTLYPEIEFARGGFRAAAELLGSETGREPEALMARMLDIVEREGRGRVFDQVLAGLGMASPELVDRLVEAYQTHDPQLGLFPDVEPTFARLRTAGLRLGVITDGLAAVQRRKLEALDLDDAVELTLLTDELGPGRAKPSPAPFELAAERLGLPPDEMAYVGNDPAKDFAGANAIGMTTIQVREPSAWSPAEPADDPLAAPDHRVEAFEALVEVVLAP